MLRHQSDWVDNIRVGKHSGIDFLEACCVPRKEELENEWMTLDWNEVVVEVHSNSCSRLIDFEAREEFCHSCICDFHSQNEGFCVRSCHWTHWAGELVSRNRLHVVIDKNMVFLRQLVPN